MTDPLDRARTALADRYEIERELGVGGMATVYLARDLKIGRQVAVKILREELAAAVGSDRFLREVRITARLNHPHILPLHDSGEIDDVLYYVMPYIAGGSLRRYLDRDTALPLDVAIRIAQQVAAALDHAHGHGVIHRDVKPENILFSEGLAIVADFGIAKAVSATARETLTRTGVPLGTPGYMSPEQAMAIVELDARTDVYSLACVVYEMLVGETPAMLPTPDDTRLGRFLVAPAEHRQRLDALPGRVEQALVKALSVQPGDRHATPGEFAEALAAATERGVSLTDSQVREILKRAAELQAEQPTQGGALSIGAVEQVAAEVGIPPQHVRQAMKEMEPASTAPMRLGEPARREEIGLLKGTLVVDRTVDAELPASVHSALVDEVEKRLGIAGHVSSLGGSLTWSPATPGGEGRQVIISIKSSAGQTKIHVEESFAAGGWFGVAFGGWTFLGIVLAGAAGAGDPGAGLVLGGMLALLGGLPTVAFIMGSMADRRRPRLEALADRLAMLAEDVARPALERGAGERS
jgi:serine/threonine protein kinase